MLSAAMEANISILVVDHHPAFLQMIVRFLEQQRARGLVVVGAVFRPDDALALAAVRQPQIVLLGLNGNTPAALGLIAPLRAMLPALGIITLVQQGIAEYQQAALAVGADGCLSSDRLHHDLLPMITSLARHTLPERRP
jgi:DNA-binding NarL/FixJ family response regulator